jgi:Holliday junction resolvase RusA-like endonuclease
MIQVFVPGVAQPQGSKNAYNRGGRCVLVEANKNLPVWRAFVTDKLEEANAGCEPMTGAISLTAIFFMPRPKSVTRALPSVKPDLDKLIRAIGDSATASGCILDDSQICEIVAHKVYEAEGLPRGVLITLHKFLGESLLES